MNKTGELVKVGNLVRIIKELRWWDRKFTESGSISLKNHLVLICKIEAASPTSDATVSEFILLTHKDMPHVTNYPLFHNEIAHL